MRDLTKSMWGIVLIIIGLVLGLNALNITNINIFFDGWWTLFIIIPSIIGLFDEKEERTGNIIALVIGVAFLLASQNIIRFEIILKLIIPFILVAIGISLLFGNNIKNKVTEKIKNTNKDNLENIVATFAEQKINKNSENFKGANLDAVFGGITLDLRESNLEKETIIKASCIFGGIDILLPNDVNVKIKSTPIFGGITNKIRNNNESKKTVYIDAFAMFGGIDIK